MGPGPDRAHAAVLTAFARSLIRIKANQLCRKPGFRACDRDDIAQDLTVAVLKKAHLYDPARGAATTFAARVIESTARQILRDRGRIKRAPGFYARSLETGTTKVGGRHVPIRDVV